MTRLSLPMPPSRLSGGGRQPGALLLALILVAGCGRVPAPQPPAPLPSAPPAVIDYAALAGPPVSVDPARVRAGLSVLAADSMEGRYTATAGAARAARYLAGEMRRAGLRPAGDAGSYLQRIPLRLGVRAEGRSRPSLLPSRLAMDTVPLERRADDANVIGILPGSDPRLSAEAVVVGAHFDHVGIGRAIRGDSVYNGADDDASGVVAVLEIARALALGPAPRRSVVFLLTTGEEVGLLGTRWYLEHPAVPLERTVADLQIEMIGRPDSLAGGPGRAWLTGFERSSVGDAFAAAGIAIVPDRRTAQNFFERSDNIAFARRGIPAHTLSSYNLHADYHTPADEVDRTDPVHMARVIEEATRAVRLLANAPAPQWKPGGRPPAPSRTPAAMMGTR